MRPAGPPRQALRGNGSCGCTRPSPLLAVARRRSAAGRSGRFSSFSEIFSGAEDFCSSNGKSDIRFNAPSRPGAQRSLSPSKPTLRRTQTSVSRLLIRSLRSLDDRLEARGTRCSSRGEVSGVQASLFLLLLPASLFTPSRRAPERQPRPDEAARTSPWRCQRKNLEKNAGHTRRLLV